jgi:hypothetical protein
MLRDALGRDALPLVLTEVSTWYRVFARLEATMLADPSALCAGGSPLLTFSTEALERAVQQLFFPAHLGALRALLGRPLTSKVRAQLDEVAEAIDFRAPEGDYETIGGLVMAVLGHIPTEGESVELTAFDPDAHVDHPPRWRATVAQMHGRRIDLIDLVKIDPAVDRTGGLL